MDVRPATPSDHERLAAVLAAAFATDPPLSFLIPDERQREPRLRRCFTALIPLYTAAGALWTTGDGRGAALWIAPGRYPLAARETLPLLPQHLARMTPTGVMGCFGSGVAIAAVYTLLPLYLQRIGLDVAEVGTVVVGRYTVTSIGSDAVEMKDASTGRVRRLVLQQNQ